MTARFFLWPFLLLAVTTTEAAVWEMGVAPTQPVDLGMLDFQRALEDPVNPFWLLKFYAPWCGHCKRLAPVLDNVAAQVSGQMSIGKIDCTTERKLCDQYKVRGYPTLKFSLDGTIHDYPAGRKETDFLAFVRKMTRPVVQPVASMTAAMNNVAASGGGAVVFLAFHPDVGKAAEEDASSSVDSLIQSSLWTQVFAQVARQHRVTTEFMVLVPDETTAEKDANLLASSASSVSISMEQPFVCRLEQHVDIRCFDLAATGKETMETTDLNQFVQTHQLPTVAQLGPNNFHALSRAGRPLVIGVVPSSDKTDTVHDMVQTLVKVATDATAPYHSKYYYGWMDGGQFFRFLEQFHVLPDELPQVFVLDSDQALFWQNGTYFKDSSSSLSKSAAQFLKDVQDGTIASQLTKGGSKGWKRVVDRLLSAFVEHRPWSIVALVLLVMAIALIVASIISPGEPLRPMPPPSRRQQQKQQQQAADDMPSTKMPQEEEAKPAAAATPAATTTAETSAQDTKVAAEEPKKEK